MSSSGPCIECTLIALLYSISFFTGITQRLSDMDGGDSERSSRLSLELSGTTTMWTMHNGPALTLYVSRL